MTRQPSPESLSSPLKPPPWDRLSNPSLGPLSCPLVPSLHLLCEYILALIRKHLLLIFCDCPPSYVGHLIFRLFFSCQYFGQFSPL